jgi:hypothetical protein
VTVLDETQVLDGGRVPDQTQAAIAKELAALREKLERDRAMSIGFPGAVDFDYTAMLPYFGYLLNNVGEPKRWI